MAPWATADDRDSAFALGVAIIGSGVRAGRRRAHLTQQQLGWLVADLDEASRQTALAALMQTMQEHETTDGVQFGSAMWIITATRADR